jgi:hypothetical protein
MDRVARPRHFAKHEGADTQVNEYIPSFRDKDAQVKGTAAAAIAS